MSNDDQFVESPARRGPWKEWLTFTLASTGKKFHVQSEAIIGVYEAGENTQLSLTNGSLVEVTLPVDQVMALLTSHSRGWISEFKVPKNPPPERSA